MWKNLLSKVRLSYQNPKEEREYLEFKDPLIKGLCIWLFVFIALLFIPLTWRYLIRDLYPQVYIGITLFVVAVIIFLFRRKLEKYFEFMSIIYLSLIIVLYIINMRIILGKLGPYEAFYLGYGFALVQKMLDHRISKFPLFIVFNVFFTVLKFTLVTIPDAALGSFVICVELFPMIISFKIERAERILFDSFHKSKLQLLKFKDFLTEYFPNQMAVLVQNHPETYYVNKSFKNCFECDDFSQLVHSFQKLDIDEESVHQNRDLFTLLGPNANDSSHEQSSKMKFSVFLELLSIKYKEIQTFRPITLQISQYSSEKGTDVKNCTNRIRQTLHSQEDDCSLLANEKNKGNRMEEVFRRETTGAENKDDHIVNNIDPNVIKIELNKLNLGSAEEIDDRTPRYSMPAPSSLKKTIWKATIFSLVWDNEDAIAVLLDDVTHEKTILELEIADKNKNMVIAMVSHDLRTPLNGMLGMIDVVESRLRSFGIEKDSDVFYYLNAFRINSQFLLNLVNSILDFSQFTNNKLTLDYTQVNMAEQLEKIKPLFDHFCKTKNLYLNIEVENNVPRTIITDKGRLSQILINLIGNAFKFTFNGGVTVRVGLEQITPCRIRISIEDTGIGIKKEDKEKLFKLFGRLEDHQKINRQGVGLGLTLSNTLAKLLDSSNDMGIEVISEFGKGSVFTFTIESKSFVCESDELELPTSERQDSPSVRARICRYSSEMKDTTYFGVAQLLKDTPIEEVDKNDGLLLETEKWCLIVDDNPFNIMVAENLMGNLCYKVKTALSGKEAIEMVQEHEKSGMKFKVILMDCEMPVMDGYEASRVLTNMMKNREITECPIVAATANVNDEGQRKLCKDAGMGGYISKPLHKDKLEEVLRKLQKNKPKV